MTPFTVPFYAFEAPPFVGVSYTAPKKLQVKKTSRLVQFSKFFAIIGIVFLLVSYGPSVWYTIRGSESVSRLLSNTANASTSLPAKDSSWQPAFDRNLPLTNSVSIPSVGIKTDIIEASNESFEDALRDGVWRVNDFGTPYDRTSPTILTAHRYGYLDWSLDFRLHNSFYELPKVKEGDTITVVWRQRKYTYAVYKSEEGTEITDYEADLILYTCRDLSSDIREIKYARLLKI